MSDRTNIPATGLKGLRQNWRNDFFAAISVALVALPLSLGIAVASGYPPVAGILSAVIGGVVTTFFRGSHLTINGPAAGLITVILGGLAVLDGNVRYVLAATIIAGAIQVVIGLLRWGNYAKMFPSSVLNGILAAIGIIIFAKQVHFAMGTTSHSDGIIDTLIDAFRLIPEINPYVAVISLCGILILIFYKRIPLRFIQLLPAPMWVLLVSIPFVYAFNFFEPHTMTLFGREYNVGPELLISIPANPLDSIMLPDFSMISTGSFWMTVLLITLVSTVITLASARAIDKLDPYKRVTNLNKDLVSVGLSTMVSGALGGLPILAVIVRSTVNVQSNAKTRWSNLYHGLLLAVFVGILSPILQSVPLAALAAILVYTGIRLASPNAFYITYDQGVEQLLFMTSTVIITLHTNILYGIIGGILIALTLHMLLAKVGFRQFFRMIFRSGSRIYIREDGSVDVKIRGITNFLSVMQLNKLLDTIKQGSVVRIDFSKSKIVDLTVMENVIEYKRIQDSLGGNVTLTGLDNHWSSSSHNRALKIIVGPRKRRITKRQMQLQKLAIDHGWTFEREADWDTSYLRNFIFFETRPIEGKMNILRGSEPKHNTNWEIADIVFDEGAMLSLEVFHLTVQVVRLNREIPRFSIEKEGLFDKIFDRVKAISGYTDHDLKLYPKVSKKFLLMGDDIEALRDFFTKDLIKFLEEHPVQHIESNGEALMIFNYLHIAPAEEVQNMLDFSIELLDHLQLPAETSGE